MIRRRGMRDDPIVATNTIFGMSNGRRFICPHSCYRQNSSYTLSSFIQGAPCTCREANGLGYSSRRCPSSKTQKTSESSYVPSYIMYFKVRSGCFPHRDTLYTVCPFTHSSFLLLGRGMCLLAKCVQVVHSASTSILLP